MIYLWLYGAVALFVAFVAFAALHECVRLSTPIVTMPIISIVSGILWPLVFVRACRTYVIGILEGKS